MSLVGMLTAYTGDWERGAELVQRASDLNPYYSRWAYVVLATNHNRQGAFEQALIAARRPNLSQFVWTPLCAVVAAGQLGLVARGAAALGAIRTRHPA